MRAETEVESLLGPDVRTPVGIPRDYRPLDVSTHPIFRIQLTDFAGPLDLLLFLIRRHEVDVFDIPIQFITERYLATLELVAQLPIDVASEFLVLATELTHIKSKMLLPVQEGVPVEAAIDDEGDHDPRAELVRRLLEYQKYRNAALCLGEREQLGREVFSRVPPVPTALEPLDPELKTVNVFRLVELMARIMRTHPTPHEIQYEVFNIAERIDYIRAFGDAREGRFALVQLLDNIRSRAELVVTFIAVLEMTRLGLLRLSISEAPVKRPRARPDDEDPYVEDRHGGSGEGHIPEGHAPDGHGDRDRGDRAGDALECASDGEVGDDAIPTIWVELTGKDVDRQIVDDYR